jgi:hypothetical protein
MPHIRITSPTHAAAFALADLLLEYGATAGQTSAGGWEVVVSLDGPVPGRVPAALAATREWLEFCGFESTSVSLDGHTHLLRSSRSPTPPESVH